MEPSYDFIIVGGGPAGCTIASTLAQSSKKPSVLLLEAGGHNDDKDLRVDGQRWSTFLKKDMNWGYQTIPQEQLGGRQIDYSRGKGLGGSSAINFSLYTVGARDDYDQWAAEVGDDAFRWEEMQARFKNLESFDPIVQASENKKYSKPLVSDHGSNGAIRLGFAAEWEKDLPLLLDVFEQAGLQRNLDHNSGNPIGVSLAINSAYHGLRTTAADLLPKALENLVIVTGCQVQRVIFQDQKAIGVESRRNKYFAKKEVIISAGTLDTPKILMHSGVGPAEQLQQFHIPVVRDLPAVGQGLKDHLFAPVAFARNPETNDRNAFFGHEATMDAAIKQWEENCSGPWARYSCQVAAGWFKSDRITSSDEFKALPASVQEFLQRETVPHYELAAPFPIHLCQPQWGPDFSYLCILVFMLNEQSTGEVLLQSSNPDDPLLFDPKFLNHPFDRRAYVESYRHVLEVTKHHSFTKDNLSTLIAPSSESDDDILEFLKNNLGSSWHMTGTVKMGKLGDADAAVDSRFRLFGIENLRVADMSVVPVLTNNHTQATAYVTGATCAEILVREYNLD